ncbi:hypothetical protein Tco_1024163 [Tanacetum coccineum]
MDYFINKTKVIKGEFEKIKDVKDEDVSLTCDAPLEVFNNKVSRLCRMDYDSEHEADDDMGYDPSDVAFTKWLGSKNFNYKTMDHYTMKALWIYWIRGDDEVELTDEESFDNEDEVAEVFRINTNLFDFETPMCKAFKEFNYLLQIDPDLLITLMDSRPMKTTRMIGSMNGTRTYHGSMRSHGLTLEFGPNPHQLNILASLSTITLDVRNGQHVVGWMMDIALEESELKDDALRNKAIMEGFIKDDDDESRYEQMRRWNIYTNYDDAYEINHDDIENEELCEVHELPVCNIRRYMMIKYSFNNDEEYVVVKEDEYDDPTITSEEACRSYQEIFRKMDKGWMVTRTE